MLDRELCARIHVCVYLMLPKRQVRLRIHGLHDSCPPEDQGVWVQSVHGPTPRRCEYQFCHVLGTLECVVQFHFALKQSQEGTRRGSGALIFRPVPLGQCTRLIVEGAVDAYMHYPICRRTGNRSVKGRCGGYATVRLVDAAAARGWVDRQMRYVMLCFAYMSQSLGSS